MLKIANIKLDIKSDEQALLKKAARLLRVEEKDITDFRIVKRSLDARRKPELFYIYTVTLNCRHHDEKKFAGRHKDIMLTNKKTYQFPPCGDAPLPHRPIIIGAGPAGLFCAYVLALKGYRPLILERGDDVDTRTQKVRELWASGQLDPNSNAQFGEGGAGTFSDGKLNTGVKDPYCRKEFVLETFVRFGAHDDILYDQKPHLGTDVLYRIMKSLRAEIEALGGEYRFRHQVTDLVFENDAVAGVEVNNEAVIPADVVVIAIGHSARDTFVMLKKHGFDMVPKAFAVGLRVEHAQNMIDMSQYGRERGQDLPPSPYKLTAKTAGGRGVYTFCMCPGGYVVNASSEEGHLCVNGMSYHARDSVRANSAVIVTVDPKDYEAFSTGDYDGPLSGIAFQRELERRAFEAGRGKIPVQTFGDFKNKTLTTELGRVTPCHEGLWSFGRVDEILMSELNDAIVEGMTDFGRKIKGFDNEDTLLCGVEARTSSPVRMTRDDEMMASFKGVYPIGEGAGYAGGITSAAIDGVKAAEKIMACYANSDL